MTSLIEVLVFGTGLPERDVLSIIANAPRRYKEYTIPKRSGGVRNISHPARELKALQRVLTTHYLDQQPVHMAAMAYQTGKSIRDNALAHAANGPILKLDFKDFFPSILARDWLAYCEDRGFFSEHTERLQATNILFHRPKGDHQLRLAIGAPSSPKLSNILMYEFDSIITEMLQNDFVTYTRYADDITFSAKRTGYLTSVEGAINAAIRKVRWPRLKINTDKTVLATKKYHRQITGLVLANDGNVSLGYERKRRISAAVHHASRGLLDEEASRRLAGMLAFAQSVEPTFIGRLEKKYGPEILYNIRKGVSIRA